MKKSRRMTLASHQAWTGRLFVLPFYIGFALFFAKPLVQSITFIFSDIKLDLGGYAVTFTGMENLKYIFTEDLEYTQNLISSVTQVLWKIPVIVLLSLFIAIILNSKFRGRTFVRAVFFLPVIVVTGAVITILQNDTTANSILTGNVVAAGSIEYSGGIEDFLINAGFNSGLINMFVTISDTMFNLLWKTGIQMIIFLAGLQSISPALYEASSIEGATAWENFFKITIPMLSPIIMVNLVYTMVDSFIDSANAVMNQVIVNSSALRLNWAAAMSWTYFLLIGILLSAVFMIFAKVNKKLN